MKETIQAYLRALEKGDLPALEGLFSSDAVVFSPVYGRRPAVDFYRRLMADTRQSKITLFDIFTNDDRRTAAANFYYEWTLADGSQTAFDCVDVFEFDPDGRIKSLKIIYDTKKNTNE
jgi:ketosteroid isomerase-like protein